MAKKKKEIDIRERCDRALELERKIKLLADEQKEVEKDIRAYAKSDKAAKTPTEGGGWSIQYPCTDGSFVRVIKDGDTLRSKIEEDDDDLAEIRKLAAGSFDYLFTSRVAYALAESFRDKAEALAREDADKLIALVSKCGKTSVTYQVAKTPES